MMSAKFIIQPNQPDVLVFENAGGAVKVTAFGLVGNDCLKFKRVVQSSQRPNFDKSGCTVHTPTADEIALSAPYQVGDCEPTIHAKRNTIFITEYGRFLPVLVGVESVGSLAVQVESVALQDFSNEQLGVSPCGCPCVETSSEWTGAERCNDDVVEREYLSNCGVRQWQPYRAVEWWETGVTRCQDFRLEKQEQSECGKTRWQRTDTVCGVSPSVPIVIEDDCCNRFTGYLFSPDEPRDPAATAEIIDCDTRILGYGYPTAGAGHTLPIQDCDGVIHAYAANQSNTAPTSAPCGCEECEPVEEVKITIKQPCEDKTVVVKGGIFPSYDDNGTITGSVTIPDTEIKVPCKEETTITI